MIIKFYDLKKNLDKNINFFLLYGNNRGFIEEIVENLLKPIFPKNIMKYEESEIMNNTNAFQESILNKSFFDENKLIIISRASDKILSTIEDIIEKGIKDIKIIILSSILEKKSKLRNFFEKSKNTIIVPFYEDNHQTLSLLATNFLKEKKINISQKNINLIIEKSKGDRINLKNELEKINLYNFNKKKIDDSSILKLINLAENYNISELVDNCLVKNKKKTLNILNENN
jgi:DNA polymerase III subunit delta